MSLWKWIYKKKRHVENSSEAINVVNSIANAKALYKSLSLKCHPDKFALNPDKASVAEGIFKELVKSKYNYSALLHLKEKIDKEL